MGLKTLFTAATLAAIATTAALAEGTTQDIKPASEIGGQRLGDLSCEVEGGWGLLLGSSKAATCTFSQVDGTIETYAGELNKLGLDIGKTNDAYMTWAVFSKADYQLVPGALIGTYSGVSAEAALGIGLGANALIGGNGKSIGLQPLAIQGNSGLNVAVGLASLNLKSVSN